MQTHFHTGVPLGIRSLCERTSGLKTCRNSDVYPKSLVRAILQRPVNHCGERMTFGVLPPQKHRLSKRMLTIKCSLPRRPEVQGYKPI